MLCEVEAPGLVEILMLMTGMLMVKVNAAFADSDVEADSLSAFAPFQLIGSSKPLPVLRATVIPSPSFHTLSGRPSELMSIRLYSSSLSEVTRPKPAEKHRKPCLYLGISYLQIFPSHDLHRHLRQYYKKDSYHSVCGQVPNQ